MARKVDRGPFFLPWTDHKRKGDPKVQWTPSRCRAAHPNAHNIFHHAHDTLVLLQYDIMYCVSLGVAQHIAGNVLYETVYVSMDKTTKGGRPQCRNLVTGARGEQA